MGADPSTSRHLAITLPDLRGGGAERMMVNLANEFAGRGHRIDLVLGRREGTYLSEVDSAVDVVDLGSPRPPGYTASGMLPGLVRYLRARDPDAMLSVLTRLNAVAVLAGRLARTGTRIVVSERNNLSRRAERADKRRMKVLPVLAGLTYPHADGIVAISEGVADDLSETAGVDRRSIDVVYNPAYTRDIDRKAAAACPHEWLDEETPVVLGVGGLSEQKDFETLIRAFATVREGREARLIILGEGERRARLESLLDSLGVAEDAALPGFVENPFAYMSRASVFVLSSAWEGFGNVLVEAMACGTAVVSTDCPSGPSEILDGGTYGPLVPVGDHATLANAIVDQLDDPTAPETLSDRARDFTVEAIADEYLEVLLPERSASRTAAKGPE